MGLIGKFVTAVNMILSLLGLAIAFIMLMMGVEGWYAGFLVFMSGYNLVIGYYALKGAWR
jgi:hypothetical protein